MLVSELKTALKRYGFSDEDPLLTWLNASYLDWLLMAYDWSFLEADPVNLSVTAGTSRLMLPSDFGRLSTIKDLTSQIKLEQYERTAFEREVWDYTATGNPDRYVLTGLNGVDIWPLPSSDRQLRIVYLTSRDELVNDTDVPDVPTALHYSIALGAAAIGLQAENEEERAQVAEAQFNNSIGRIWSRLAGPASRDEPGGVRDVMGYNNYGN